MESQKEIIKTKCEEQQKLRQFLTQDVWEKMHKLVSENEEKKKLKKQMLEEEKIIAQNKAAAEVFKKAIENLSLEFESVTDKDIQEESDVVDQKVLNHLDGKAFFTANMTFIDEYQELHESIQNVKTLKQLQDELEIALRKKERIAAKSAEVRTRIDEKKRCIAEGDYPANRKILELEKKILSVKQQYEKLEEPYEAFQGRVAILESKKKQLEKELKKKQQLKAMEKGLSNSNMLKQGPTSTSNTMSKSTAIVQYRTKLKD